MFAQMVDDPSAHPDLFPTEKKQERSGNGCSSIIEELVKWENTTNEKVLEQARNENLAELAARVCGDVDHPRAKELFDRYKLLASTIPLPEAVSSL